MKITIKLDQCKRVGDIPLYMHPNIGHNIRHGISIRTLPISVMMDCGTYTRVALHYDEVGDYIACSLGEIRHGIYTPVFWFTQQPEPDNFTPIILDNSTLSKI